MGAVLAGGITGGVAVVKMFERWWPSNGNGKLEHLMEQQLELMKKSCDRDTELAKTLALMQLSMETHQQNEADAWKDAFGLLRDTLKEVQNG